MMCVLQWVSILSIPLLLCLSCEAQKSPVRADENPNIIDEKGIAIQRMHLSDEEWAKKLSKEAFNVLRKKGTERAFSGAYWNHHEKGVYTCAGCGLSLFASDTKFESGTGWPSFYKPFDKTHVGESKDNTLGMVRIEVHCNRCGGHLGHIFDDGPAPTGLRYCLNSVSLGFHPEEEK